MRPRLLLALLLGTALAAGAGCSRRGERAAARASVVALVGDRPVEEETFEAYVKAATGEEPKKVSPQVASSLLDQLLEEILLDRAVEDASPKAAGATPEEKRRDVLTRRARLAEITDAELKAEYDAHPERTTRPPLLRVSQMLLTTREKAEQARKKLLQGVPWLTVSKELSVAPNAAQGGALGLLARGDLPREFEKAVWGLPAGGITPILSASHGFHILRVDERTAERTIPFEEARAAIRLALAEERSSQAASDLLAESRKRHPPQVVEEHLPFPYVGTTARVSLDSRP